MPQVIREVSADPAGARSVATTALGKRLVDETRSRSAALEGQISAGQAARQRADRASANNAVEVAIVVLIALTLLTLALSGVLGWLLVGRERAEALYRRTEQTARTLQESLLPAEVPAVPSCELAIHFTPAGADELVGGDFYDVFAVGPDHWAIVMGDVCGKGAGAAAVTSMARWTLRTLADTVLTPAEVLRSLNDVMLHQATEQRFITIINALLEVRDAVAHVRVACAGRSPERAIRKLDGDRSADALADALRDEAERWTETPRDDVAIVALRYLPARAPGLTVGPAAA